MKQFTLRQIPPIVEEKIRELADQQGQSLNKTVIYLLKKALGLEKTKEKYRDVSSISSTWSEEEANTFIKHCEVFEQIDEEMWK
jgi:hypothetical protein